MTPLRELRYDRVTFYPRPRYVPPRRDPSHHLSEIFPPIRIADFLPRRKKRRNPGRDTGVDAAAAGADQPRKPRLSTPEPGVPSLECGLCGSSEEDEDDDEEEEEEDESNATARYVVGPDSIRFLAPVDQGSLVVFDRWREVHVPSPWSQSYWSKHKEPWQRFYLDRGAGWRVNSEKEMNQELWIAFLLDRGAGRHSRWWMEVELAFASARATIDAPPCPAKRRCLSPADDSAAAAPGLEPLGQEPVSGAAEDDRGRHGDWSRTEDDEI
jgi:hypothetical protein